MTAEDSIDAQRSLNDAAAKWLVILQSEDCTGKQRAEFVDWLRESPSHIAKMLQMSQLHRSLSSFEGWSQLARGERAPGATVLQLFAGRDKPALLPNQYRTRVGLAIAASIVAMVGLGFPLISHWGEKEFRTQGGERREITLADGSVVEMAPASDVVVRYRQRERLILLKEGEALFHVTKNADRPFIVQASRTRIRAVGTIFNVGRGAEGVSVTVLEGRVAVSEQTSARSDRLASGTTALAVSLGANEQVSIGSDGSPSRVRALSTNADVKPTADQIVFENETVAEVARRFNAQNQMKIEIVDARLADRRVSGLFQAKDPQSFVVFIEAATNAHVSSRDATHIVVGASVSRTP